MVIPDYPAKTRKVRIIQKNNPAVIPTPNKLALLRFELRFTKYAISH
jgi:hypothetical protein